ncbi:MAG: hypothetical protein ACD_34C00633G0003 [uncultured bacterium]|nr:MAG: hypothetical protein ACD_34C00633G0003 [uncultured bacterium]
MLGSDLCFTEIGDHITHGNIGFILGLDFPIGRDFIFIRDHFTVFDSNNPLIGDTFSLKHAGNTGNA